MSRRLRGSASALRLGFAIAGFTFFWAGQGSCICEAQARDDVARAQRLIDEVEETYRSLPAYVDRGQVSEVSRFRGKQRTKTSFVSLAFARPNRLAVRFPKSEVVCDGKKLSIGWALFRRYVVIEAPESVTYSTFTHRMDDTTRNVAFSDRQTQLQVVMALLSGTARAAKILPSLGTGPVAEPDRMLDGKRYHSVLYTKPVDVDMAASMRLLIDPDTKLVKQIHQFYRITPEQLAFVDKEEPAMRWDISTTWTALSIQTAAAPAELFTYRPPQDFIRVGNFKHVTLLDRAGFDQPTMVRLGRPAPDFTLTMVDNTPSSRTVSKSDLAGKVVVIAYWSMHTEACFEALREIQKAVQSASANEKVVLVALNVDQDPEDVSALSARVREVLLKKKIALDGSRGCSIAVDPTGAISDLLPVSGMPAVVLLDGKSIVQSFHSGTGAELTGKLSKEIEMLLAGTPLETPELKALNRVDADESRPTVLIAEPAAFKKIEELGGIVIRAGGEGTTAEIDIQLGGEEPGDESLAKLVPHLKQIEQITCLDLKDTGVTDAGIEQLKGMSNIGSINLEGHSISDRGMDPLKTVSGLKYVALTGTARYRRRNPGLEAGSAWFAGQSLNTGQPRSIDEVIMCDVPERSTAEPNRPRAFQNPGGGPPNLGLGIGFLSCANRRDRCRGAWPEPHKAHDRSKSCILRRRCKTGSCKRIHYNRARLCARTDLAQGRERPRFRCEMAPSRRLTAPARRSGREL